MSSIREKFKIPEHVQVKVKAYGSDWNEWVKTSVEERKGKEKLKVFQTTTEIPTRGIWQYMDISFSGYGNVI